ncbi:hypothetical protein [Oceanobacillus sojae]
MKSLIVYDEFLAIEFASYMGAWIEISQTFTVDKALFVRILYRQAD